MAASALVAVYLLLATAGSRFFHARKPDQKKNRFREKKLLTLKKFLRIFPPSPRERRNKPTNQQHEYRNQD